MGQPVGVDITIDHINTADIPARITAEIAAGQGHDLIQYIACLAVRAERARHDRRHRGGRGPVRRTPRLTRRNTYNPTTEKFFGYCHGWAPDPGNYRRSLWEAVGMPDGPRTWEDLLEGGRRIKKEQGVQMGIGMSQRDRLQHGGAGP